MWQQKGFAAIIKLRILRWKDYSVLSLCGHCDQKAFVRRLCQSQREIDLKILRCWHWRWAKQSWANECRQILRLGKLRKDSPLKFPEGMHSYCHLGFSPVWFPTYPTVKYKFVLFAVISSISNGKLINYITNNKVNTS